MDSFSDVRERLRQYRLSQGKTQSVFAQELGLTQAHYGQIEGGLLSLSYAMLKKLENHGCDINYLMTGQEENHQNPVFEEVLDCCDAHNRHKVYSMMITGFYQMWDWNLQSRTEQCLCSELRAMNVLGVSENSYKRCLYYLRITNHMSQQDFSALLGIGRTKCGKCECGEQHLDAEAIWTLYENGYCMPSFFFEKYIGIGTMSHLLSQNRWSRQRYYKYMETILTDVASCQDALTRLQQRKTEEGLPLSR
jgi:DNA-binding XRE family transcriptional regulator